MPRVSTTSAVVAALGFGVVVGLATPAAAHETKHLISGKSIRKSSIAGNRLKSNTVTGKQIQESTLGTVPSATTATRLPALTWITATPQNGWVSPADHPAAYAIDAQGIVHLRGIVESGTAGTVAFTMPSSYGTGDVPLTMADVDAGGSGFVDVAAGALTPYNGSGGASEITHLDGITFSPGS